MTVCLLFQQNLILCFCIQHRDKDSFSWRASYFVYLTYSWKNKWSRGVDFGINSIFPSLVSPDISGTSGDMSWLQGGRFIAVSGYSHAWESKQYYRTRWSMGYLQQGHVDPNFFLLLLLLLFLWAFFRSGLDYNIAGSSFPVWFVASLLRLAVRVMIKLTGRLCIGQMMRGGGVRVVFLASCALCPQGISWGCVGAGSKLHSVSPWL